MRGWRTQDLAAHLYVRERKLGALPGIGFERFAERTAAIQQEALHSMDYPDLVREIRRPGWIMRPLDDLVNTSEMFIHHEDVLRANDRSQKLTPKEQAKLWPMVTVMARRVQAKAGVQVRIGRSDTGDETQIGTGSRILHLRGLPSELLLHLTGRDSDVEMIADPPVLDEWLRSLLTL
ncbi:maleylpyruvate isomerase family mycothiol-dependent enzyme [Tessaracoccus sp. HDW20]|uniref:maleylpyruvate isomerase family mycothiol-dependent enzyme n=1 Tax=Tessaracoccus coleopterorum TaxID=2714950 RepID=UPI0018D4483A|nr:maleylpyruvate isomerase family mycothiol-dependent enzyme [Tessaracoccus coleopterorum]